MSTNDEAIFYRVKALTPVFIKGTSKNSKIIYIRKLQLTI